MEIQSYQVDGSLVRIIHTTSYLLRILIELRRNNIRQQRHCMASVGADQAIVELREVTRLLQLIFHRNKNQHHLAKWWKWLSMLKRCLLELPHEKPTAVKARVTYMSDFLMPRCHR